MKFSTMRIRSEQAKHFWMWSLHGTEEMKLFPDKEASLAALGRVEVASSGLRLFCECLGGLLIFAISFYLATLANRHLGVAAVVFGRPIIVAFLILIPLSYAYYRAGVRLALRSELAERGVPICINCSYRLDGLTQFIQHCPECGEAVHAAVRAELMTKNNVLPYNSSQ